MRRPQLTEGGKQAIDPHLAPGDDGGHEERGGALPGGRGHRALGGNPRGGLLHLPPPSPCHLLTIIYQTVQVLEHFLPNFFLGVSAQYKKGGKARVNSNSMKVKDRKIKLKCYPRQDFSCWNVFLQPLVSAEVRALVRKNNSREVGYDFLSRAVPWPRLSSITSAESASSTSSSRLGKEKRQLVCKGYFFLTHIKIKTNLLSAL